MAFRKHATPLTFRSETLNRLACLMFVMCAFFALSLPSRSLADESDVERGISYTCDSARYELKIATLWRDGGGAEDPFVQFEKEDSALWNVDRSPRALPMIKTCAFGGHKIVAVFFKSCALDEGGYTVALYSNAKVSVDGKGGLHSEGAHPFAQAELPGGSCSGFSFENIVVGLGSRQGAKLTVTMK
jgi:hypothetical protein